MCSGKTKTYMSAPLPFMGQKRRFAKEFKEIIERLEGIDTIVDLFGGSGLLSHIAKRTRPEIRVVYNDFDHYDERISNIDRTNRLLAEIRPLLASVADKKKLPDGLRAKVLEIVREHSKRGFVDYITLSSSLLFSGKFATSYEKLAKHTMYNVIKQNDYNAAGYLDGLEITHEDYITLSARFKDSENVLFLLDPPYLSTEVGMYDCYWKLSDYLDVLKLLQGTKYVYFTSDKSQVVELCRWLHDNPLMSDPFKDAEIRRRTNHLNYTARYEDIMLVKR